MVVFWDEKALKLRNFLLNEKFILLDFPLPNKVKITHFEYGNFNRLESLNQF